MTVRNKKVRKLPAPGTVYKRLFKGKEYQMTVIEKNGKIYYNVNNTLYSSPSSAAKPIFKNEINGWRFWRMDK